MKSPRLGLPLLAVLMTGVAPLAHAIEPIPETPGWSGIVVLGAGYVDVRSNLVAGNGFIDIGRPDIDSIFQSPQSDNTFHPVVTGEINYTFSNGWQAFLGTALEDAVTLDAVSQAGVRKDLGGAGILQGGVLFSGIPTETWQDPYAEGAPREETDRDSTGLRLQWDRVLGSAFQATFSYRDISIDDERSGQGVHSVSCSVACQDLLRRDGDQYAFDLSYLYRLGVNRNHLLRPMVRYTVDDRDGAAVAADAWRLQLSYVYVGQAFTLTSNLTAGAMSRDERNPLFDAKTDADRFAVDATLFYPLPGTDRRWQLVGHVLWGEDDSDVRFHDSQLFMMSIGAMYRFGQREARG
jgi:hypothetical protein